MEISECFALSSFLYIIKSGCYSFSTENLQFIVISALLYCVKGLSIFPIIFNSADVSLVHLGLYNSFLVTIYFIVVSINMRIKFFFFYMYILLATF